MKDTYVIDIIMSDGTVDKVNVITYLLSDDNARQYVVYTKDETYGDSGDRIIYISKLQNNNGSLAMSEISDDTEWTEVQRLLRRIANAVTQ